MKKFYLTTPLYYVNDKPHIGHAYTTVAADVLARWKRLKGESVFFLTGTDEHGSKIAQAAEAHKVSPIEYADRLSAEFKKLWVALGITNDDFIRTTEKRHVDVVQKIFQKLQDQGDIFKGFYEDWYCVSDESFWLESQLKEGKCPECGRAVQKLKEETYFFKLSKYEKPLLDYYSEHTELLSPPHRGSEMINFVKSGLKDLSVSRLNEKWGIPVPSDPKHTVYVWFDALINYITVAGYDPASANPASAPGFKDLWPCDVHFVGKEIFRFHVVIWPAMLMALGLPLPKKVFAHGWWTVDGQKMSKSRGNMVDPITVAQDFGVDGFRYFILREIPFGVDGDFSIRALQKRYNTELANDLGNLFSRALNLIEKNMGGTVKELPKRLTIGELSSGEPQKTIDAAYDQVAFGEVLERLMNVAKDGNLFMEKNAPWKLAKENPERCAEVLSEVAVVLAWVTAGFYPFMPEVTEKMWALLGQSKPLKEIGWKIFQDPLKYFETGRAMTKGAILFPKKETK